MEPQCPQGFAWADDKSVVERYGCPKLYLQDRGQAPKSLMCELFERVRMQPAEILLAVGADIMVYVASRDAENLLVSLED